MYLAQFKWQNIQVRWNAINNKQLLISDTSCNNNDG